MKKRILALILCLISAVTLCGCGSISYVLQIDSASGVVTQGVVFSVSQSDIEETGKSITDFKQHVEAVANAVVQNSFNSFETAHAMTDMMTTYDGQTVSYAEIVLWTEHKIDPQTKRPQIIWEVDGDTLNCSIALRFLSVYAYMYFYDNFPNSEDDTEEIIEQHVFYYKKINEQKSPFSNLNTSDIANYFISYFGTSFGLEDMTYSFAYSTPDAKLYSDADTIQTSSSGNRVHIWNWTASELENDGGKIQTYTIRVKTPVWYMLGIASGLGTALVLWIVCKKRENKK